jgi:alpha-tubulin suppressor-like RCC1 family protein
MTGQGDAVSRSSPTQIGSLNTWAKISAGNPNGFDIKTDGTMWSWGGNSSANLGHNDTIYRSSPKQVGALATWLLVSANDIHTVSLQG